MACCPAHDDRSPSLSIGYGENGILLNCFAGCSLSEIAEALGIRIRDLFKDASVTRRPGKTIRGIGRKQDRGEQAFHGLLLDAAREADSVIGNAHSIDIDLWSPRQLDAAVETLALAYIIRDQDPFHAYQ
jgi:hypothetical protein